jgi:photosystem II stability/assembly factor-like uncharacterized protein
VWAVGQGGIILRTTDGGATWTPHPQGSTQTLYAIDAVDASTAWAVGEAGTILKTTDGGATWTPQASGTGAALNGISAVSTTTAWAVGAGGVILKSEDGSTWTPQNSRVTAALYGISAIDAYNCWAVGEGGTILKTSDGGLTWTPQGTTTVTSVATTGADAGANAASETAALPAVSRVTTFTLRAVVAANPSVCWAVGEGGAVKTVDGGLTWTLWGGTGSALYGACAYGASALAVGVNGTSTLLP